MSVEINVLFHGTLPVKVAPTPSMKELGFPLAILPSAGFLEKQSVSCRCGFGPKKLGSRSTYSPFTAGRARAS
jgi:hypothetical protein